MTKIALASTILSGTVAAAATIGIGTYLYKHKHKSSENDFSASSFAPQLKNDKYLKKDNNNIPNLDNNSSKNLTPSGTYTINGRKIKLYRQQKSDCWAYAAAFVACLRGKGDNVTLEDGYFKNIVDNEMRCDRWSFGDSEQIKTMLKTMQLASEGKTITDIKTVDDVKNTLSGELKDGKYVLIQPSLGKLDCEKLHNKIATGQMRKSDSGHWMVICKDCGNGNFEVYDSLKGKVVNMSAEQIFDMLPTCSQEIGTIQPDGKHTGHIETCRIMDVIYA